MNDDCLVIDVGSTGCRAAVIDAAGGSRSRAFRKLPVEAHGERVEYDAEALLAAVEAVVIEAAGDHRIAAAGMAVQRGSVVCWDRQSGRALSPVISWRDRRTSDEPAIAIAPAEIKRRTGLRYSPYAGAPKLAWCRRHLPAVARAERSGRLAAGPLGSFLAARLTGSQEPRIDDTLAQRTLLWSRHGTRWDPVLLDAFGIDRACLPRRVGERSNFGRLRCVPGRPPLVRLVGDQNAVPFLDPPIDGRPDPDTLYVNLGTGGFLLRPRPDFVDSDVFQVSTLGPHRGWALEASVHGAASAIDWLAREVGRALDPGRLASLPERLEPPLFLNTVGGLGSPWWQAGPDPAFTAVDEAACDRLEMKLMAVVESIAFLVRANVDAMKPLAGAPRRVVLSGGLARAEVLVQRLAALLDGELLRLSAAEATTLGLWCRMRGGGLEPDAFERVTPAPDEGLGERYRRWLDAMPPIEDPPIPRTGA